jgi:hypothetical protein
MADPSTWFGVRGKDTWVRLTGVPETADAYVVEIDLRRSMSRVTCRGGDA